MSKATPTSVVIPCTTPCCADLPDAKAQRRFCANCSAKGAGARCRWAHKGDSVTCGCDVPVNWAKVGVTIAIFSVVLVAIIAALFALRRKRRGE